MPLPFCATLHAASVGQAASFAARRQHTFNSHAAGARSARTGAPQQQLQRHVVAKAAASGSGDEENQSFALAPSKPISAVGEMAAYYLEMQPHLFRAAVETEFEKLRESREAAAAAEAAPPSDADSADLVLSRRMAEVRRMEESLAIEDLMYVCILEKFQSLGVPLLPDCAPVPEHMETLKALTEGVHTREALDMVKEHLLSVLGPASMAVADTRVKMSKLQAAQVYAASIMFGYFLRRVDSRFQLARQMGMIPESPEEAVARLERLFAAADGMDSEDVNPDFAAPPEPVDANADASGAMVRKERGALRRYVESFDQEAMMATARLVSSEGAALVERQTKGLYGDVKALQSQMQEAVGRDAGSMEELLARVQEAVASGAVEVLDVTVGTQRRAVLEAVAYGCFLRDVESWVDTDYAGLLTPAVAGQ